ncbi:MAG TPA: DUF6600 domain-containing protein [Blastocatellia bacterium]|nr:DUF6600 domain-containing protein [Blastocatellia bacterium]
MKLSLPATLMLLVLAAILLAPITLAQTAETNTPDTADGEDDAPVERVARITFIEGDASFLRAGTNEWTSVAENLPLFTGDQVYTGRGARAEIQLSRGNYIRLSEHTALTITELSHTAAQFEVTEGTALIRLERFGTAFARFEVDTPNAALTLEQDGFYRVNVRGDHESEVITRQGAVEVATADGSFKVREGHRLVIDTSTGRLEIAVDNSLDNWDQWSTDRDRAVDRGINVGQVIQGAATVLNLVFSRESENNCFYGASELGDYGSWVSDDNYGHCWVPRVAAGWAPYRHGQWLWVPRAGWTWLSSEPWGWAPYHYGRWAFIPRYGWAWAPGIGSRYSYAHSYYQWRPALVHFFNSRTPNGDYVGWYPLTPGERWRRPDRSRDNDHDHLRYPTARDGARRPQQREGLTVIHVDGFARPDRSKLRPAAPDRDLNTWIGNGARPGLPEIAPTQRVVAPVWNRKGNDKLKAIAPPAEVINRPVVTRNRPVDAEIVNAAPRERRLIVPPRQRDSFHMPSREERGVNHDHERRPPQEKREASGPETVGDEAGRKRERPRPDFIPAPKPTRDNSSGDSNAEERQKRPSGERVRPRDDESSKARQHQPQPRPEYRDQGSQERRQERQEQKQERREERREERSSGKRNKDN